MSNYLKEMNIFGHKVEVDTRYYESSDMDIVSISVDGKTIISDYDFSSSHQCAELVDIICKDELAKIRERYTKLIESAYDEFDATDYKNQMNREIHDAREYVYGMIE